MKPFPSEQVSAEEALKAVRKSLLQLYKITRTDRESATYDGYDLHRKLLATCLSPDQQLTKDSLERTAEQNRDPLDVVLMIAFQLGYSNAQVRADLEMESMLKTIDMLREAAASGLKAFD